MALNRLTSFKLHGEIESVYVIESEDDLYQLPDQYKVLGAGSNVIVDPSIKIPVNSKMLEIKKTI